VQPEESADSLSAENAFPESSEAAGFMGHMRGAALRLLGETRRADVESHLIATLNEVASAVSSAMSVEQVLDVIVERAKTVTDTDKAVLVLADHHGEDLDFDTMVVRGSRDQHSQDWWETRLGVLGHKVFETGQPLIERHPEEDALLLANPVLVRDHPVGLLGAINSADRPFSREQVEFLSVLSAFAAAAIENAQLAEQSRYVLLASERDRIAREMHDGVVQSLFSISLGLELCKKQVFRDPTAVSTRLEELQEQLNMAMTELRRFIYDLRPMKLTELGLVGAVEFWVQEITQGRPVRGRVIVHGEVPRLTPSEEACLYRVTKEAVSNIVRHANAGSFEVAMSFSEGRAAVSIEDDGGGFDAEWALAGGTQGLGLKGIRDRLAREQGTFNIASGESGTRVSVEIPIGGSG